MSPVRRFVHTQGNRTLGGFVATVNVTTENIESLLTDNEIVILDFWASWCRPCMNFGPVFEGASEKNEDIVFGKIDTEAQRELAAQFKIRSIPTIVVFRQQIPIYNKPGAFPAPAFDQLIESIRGVDMDDIRKQLAAHESAAKAAQPE